MLAYCDTVLYQFSWLPLQCKCSGPYFCLSSLLGTDMLVLFHSQVEIVKWGMQQSSLYAGESGASLEQLRYPWNTCSRLYVCTGMVFYCFYCTVVAV